jgi:hypothetical protein
VIDAHTTSGEPGIVSETSITTGRRR